MDGQLIILCTSGVRLCYEAFGLVILRCRQEAVDITTTTTTHYQSGQATDLGQVRTWTPHLYIRHWAYMDCRIENYPVNRCPADLTWLLESLPGLESVRTQPWTLNTALGWLCFSYWQARIHSVLPHMKQNRQEIWTKFPPLLFSRMLWGFVFH